MATTRSGEEKPDPARTSLDLASGCGGEDELDAGRGEAILRAAQFLFSQSFMLLTCAGICIIVFNCLLGHSTIVFLSSFHLIHINVSLIPADRGWKERIRASDQ